MGKYYDQSLLRNDAMFAQVIEAAVSSYASVILAEATSVPFHAERVAMANEIIDTGSLRRAKFVDRAVYEAVLADPIRTAAVQNGEVAASRVPDNILEAGISQIWNKVTLAVWPDIVADVAAGNI